MSKADVWMPLYVADYLADTGHLSTQEHGAYLLLLMHSWRVGPLPEDEAQLARLARCSLSEWRKIAATVLAFFTKASAGGYVQGRLEREREAAETHSERRANAARKAAEARWQGNASGMRDACESHSERNASEMRRECPPPSPSHTPVKVKEPNPSGSPSDRDFDDFWAAYPRKVGKDAARKAFLAAKKRAPIQAIAAGLNAARWPTDPQFIPHPATWLNQGRWADDPEAAAPEPPSKLDWMRELMGGPQ